MVAPPCDDPANATLGDLAADMARLGLEFASREPQQEQSRDTQPVLIVATNEVPGLPDHPVHGDVFGLILGSIPLRLFVLLEVRFGMVPRTANNAGRL
jgi:hypothetical protein